MNLDLLKAVGKKKLKWWCKMVILPMVKNTTSPSLRIRFAPQKWRHFEDLKHLCYTGSFTPPLEGPWGFLGLNKSMRKVGFPLESLEAGINDEVLYALGMAPSQ